MDHLPLCFFSCPDDIVYDEVAGLTMSLPSFPFSSPVVQYMDAPQPTRPKTFTLPFDPQRLKHKYSGHRSKRRPVLDEDDANRLVNGDKASSFCSDIFYTGPMNRYVHIVMPRTQKLKS